MSTEVVEETTDKTSYYKMYKVIFHNDNKTTMDFVIMVLMRFFNHDTDSAVKVMMEVHNKGKGVAGIYPLEHAELKKEQTESLARTHKFPLKLSLEKDE